MTVIIAGTGVSATILAGTPFPVSRAYLITCVATFMLARARIRFRDGSDTSFSALILGTFFALFTFGLAPTIAVTAIAVWLFSVDLDPPDHSGVRTMFNIANVTLAVAAAHGAARTVGASTGDTTHVLEVVASVAAYHIVNTLLHSGAVALSHGQPFIRVWNDTYLTAAAPFMTFAGSGAAAALVLQHQPRNWAIVPVAAVPAFLAYRAFKTEVERRGKSRMDLEAARLDASTDPLTGLPNRRAFLERCRLELARAQRASEPLAVLMIDLDGFKGLNDTHGHLAGDAALRAVATGLRDAVRAYDVPGRLAGDEFVVLLPHCDAVIAEARRADLQAHLCRLEVPVPGGSWRVGASVGAAIFPYDGRNPERLLECADAAMYADKQHRRCAAREPHVVQRQSQLPGV